MPSDAIKDKRDHQNHYIVFSGTLSVVPEKVKVFLEWLTDRMQAKMHLYKMDPRLKMKTCNR